MSDEELLAEARKFEKNLLNFFWRQGVQYSEGEDLVQETYLRLWKYRREYKPTAKLSTFLFLMARQVRIDALRRQTRREGREKSWGKEAATTAAPSVGSADAREDVRWAIGRRTLGGRAAFRAAPGSGGAWGLPGSSVRGGRGDPRDSGGNGKVAHVECT